MRTLLITSFFLFTLGLSGQNLFPEKFSDCESEFFFLEGREIYTKNLNEDLISDIIKAIEPKILKRIKGIIKIQIYVDTIGSPCCISIKNDLNSKGKKVDFKQIINSQTKWSPPIREGKNTAASLIFRMAFYRDEIILQRMGFNTKSGLSILQRMEIKRE